MESTACERDMPGILISQQIAAEVRNMAKRRVTGGSGAETSKGKIKICNIEKGLPTVGQAHKRIEEEIAAAKFGKWSCMKLIHGYGSSGKGGMIKNSLPSFLDAQMRRGNIRDYIRGEDFSIFDSCTQRALLRYPDLSGDPDLEKCNHGITIILL